MNFKTALFTLCIIALSWAEVSVAQTQQPERVGAGNAPVASATSRMEVTRQNVIGFIGEQERILQSREVTVRETRNNLTTRLGQLAQTLVNYSGVTTGGCSPNAGPHGCSCACPVGSKIIWNGTAWSCYQPELPTCPAGQQFNAATCKCQAACVPPPNGCPPGYHWDPVLCQCKCDTEVCVCPPPRWKDQYGICRCPVGLNECRQPGMTTVCVECTAGTFNPNTCTCDVDCQQFPTHPNCGGSGGCHIGPENCPAGYDFNAAACACECTGPNCQPENPVCPSWCPPGSTLVGCSCRPLNPPNPCPPGTGVGPNGSCVPLCP